MPFWDRNRREIKIGFLWDVKSNYFRVYHDEVILFFLQQSLPQIDSFAIFTSNNAEGTTFYFCSGNCKNKFTELERYKPKNLILFNNLNVFTDHLQKSPILQIFYLEVFLSHSFMSFFSRFYSLIMMLRI